MGEYFAENKVRKIRRPTRVIIRGTFNNFPTFFCTVIKIDVDS